MRYLVIALAAITACSVSAQTAKKPASKAAAPAAQVAPAPGHVDQGWEKEPEAFLGIKFNEPFSVATCPTKTYGQYVKTESLDYEAMKSIEGVCVDTTDTLYKYQKPENGRYKLAHLPAIGVGYAVNVQLKDGIVSKITIDMKQSAFDTMLTAFKDRYGAPTSIDSGTVKNNAGGEFSAADVLWKGKKISIRMYERLNRIDESYVVISDNAIMAAEVAARRAKVASEAQKF
jgi:hypothetical protein